MGNFAALGVPLALNDGSCVGTLCLVDTRARSLAGTDVGLLQDLRDLAVQELYQTNVLRSLSLRPSL